MDRMKSSEFRKRYAQLIGPVIVTVNGHPIGVWSPRELSPDGVYVWPSDKLMADSTTDRFNSRPFTPVPKKGR